MKQFINNMRLARLAKVRFDSEELKPGPIVYTRTHTLLPQMKWLASFPPCVLITSFSDAHVTSKLAGKLPPNVRAWFSNNVATSNPRVHAVPLGLRASPEGEECLRRAMDRGRLPQRNLVYMNFWRKLSRRPQPRRGIYERFGAKKWVTTEGGFEHVPISHFYEQMASHPYVLSPPGAGDDCHRHWEAILLGTIPIVLKGGVTKLLEPFPCLLVDSWGDVTEDRLAKELAVLHKRFQSPVMEQVWFDYWRDRILKA